LQLTHKEQIEALESKYRKEIQDLEEILKKLNTEKEELSNDLDLSKTENKQLQSCIATQTVSALAMETQLKTVKIQLEVN
jgi:hypothetical protein